MQPLAEANALAGGGLELVATRALPSSAAAGGPLKLGLLWRATQDGPTAQQVEVRLLRATGEVVQRTALPLLGGRLAPSTLSQGSVVRDEQTLVISARVPTDEPLSVELGLLDGQGQAVSTHPSRLGTLKVSGRPHQVEPTPAADANQAEASFGGRIQLVRHALDPTTVAPGGTVHVRLHWRGLGQMDQAYKIFVHVLDPSASQVLAQRDAEPQAGAAPTTSWLPGEVLDDDFAITLPPNIAAGEYPIEVGIYEPRSGERLPLPNGDSRVLLSSRLQVR
jgi:hypothetical protein